MVNATLSPGTGGVSRVTVASITWQNRVPRVAGSYTWGWREDALVGDPFAFQVTVDANLLSGKLRVKNAAGTALAEITPALANASTLCPNSAGGAVPGTQCYLSPGNAGYVTPQPVPAAGGAFSVRVMATCDGKMTPGAFATQLADRTTRCAPGETAGAVALLTVSPLKPVTTTPKAYTLELANAAGAASTPFEVALVPPQPPRLPIGVGVSGGGGTPPGMPPPVGPCSGGTQEQSFSFTMTCFAGGTGSSWPIANSGCDAAAALQGLTRIYQLELQQGCVIH